MSATVESTTLSLVHKLGSGSRLQNNF